MTACNNLPTETPPEVERSDLRVDLRAQQTPMRNQGSRRSCQSFAAIAALEAAYKRLGYGDKDLSEEFLTYFGKNFWLHHREGDLLWDEIEAKGTDGSENQLGFTGGGGGAGKIQTMLEGEFKVPLETDMPYISNSRPYLSNPNRYSSYRDPRYKKQRNVNSFNLDSTNIPHRLLHSPNYHGVANARIYGWERSRNTGFIENILKRKMEVVWDFGGFTKTGPVWEPCSEGDSGCINIAHSMLIVGFDRTDPDPDNHYFMVKNSWGSAWTATDDSLTYISYDLVRQRGASAAHIVLPTIDVDQWNDVKLIGRWDLVFDGHEATLDIYHIPGFWPSYQLGVPDRRIGSLYIEDQAYRVNGSFDGNKITFYFSNGDPNLRWDKLDGRKFVYYYSDSDYMAGFHTDPDGGTYGGYARKAGSLPGGLKIPRPFLPSSYEHTKWQIRIGQRKGTIQLNSIEPYEGEFPEFYNISGTFTETGTDQDRNVQFRIPQREYSHFFIEVEDSGDRYISLEGRALNHKPGNIAGHTTAENGEGKIIPFVMYAIQ